MISYRIKIPGRTETHCISSEAYTKLVVFQMSHYLRISALADDTRILLLIWHIFVQLLLPYAAVAQVENMVCSVPYLFLGKISDLARQLPEFATCNENET